MAVNFNLVIDTMFYSVNVNNNDPTRFPIKYMAILHYLASTPTGPLLCCHYTSVVVLEVSVDIPMELSLLYNINVYMSSVLSGNGGTRVFLPH